jgi:hypothetical protein
MNVTAAAWPELASTALKLDERSVTRRPAIGTMWGCGEPRTVR